MKGSAFCGPHHDQTPKRRRDRKQKVQRKGSVAVYRPDPAVREAALARIRLALSMERELEDELERVLERDHD